MRKCGFEARFGSAEPCPKPAAVYGGWPGAGDWACYACADHAAEAARGGYQVWDRLPECEGTSGHAPGVCEACDAAFADLAKANA